MIAEDENEVRERGGWEEEDAERYAIAVEVAQIVDLLGKAARAAIIAIEQGVKIGGAGLDERVGTDPDQPEAGGAVGLALEQMAGGAEHGLRQPARIGKAA